MAIFRFFINGGGAVDFPYDFGETPQKTLAIEQYYGLFETDIREFKIVEGDTNVDTYRHLNPVTIRTSYTKQEIEQLLIDHQFYQHIVADALHVSPRKMCYIIKKLGLRQFADDGRRERVQRERKNRSWANSTDFKIAS